MTVTLIIGGASGIGGRGHPPAARTWPPGDHIYGATKWAVTGLAENARLMVTHDGIGVTLIAPGRVGTGFWDNHAGGPPDVDMLPAEKVGEAIVWALTQPAGVDVNTMIVRPVGQPV
jgi:NADP-dependent 3-hydroxy acid dehydrogenase YdfG